MLVVGPISSAFDFLTFYVMLVVLKASAPLFQTGWFVESLCTQVLVIFIIRTRGNPFRSRPHPVLAATSLAVAAIGAVLPYCARAPHQSPASNVRSSPARAGSRPGSPRTRP